MLTLLRLSPENALNWHILWFLIHSQLSTTVPVSHPHSSNFTAILIFPTGRKDSCRPWEWNFLSCFFVPFWLFCSMMMMGSKLNHSSACCSPASSLTLLLVWLLFANFSYQTQWACNDAFWPTTHSFFRFQNHEFVVLYSDTTIYRFLSLDNTYR